MKADALRKFGNADVWRTPAANRFGKRGHVHAGSHHAGGTFHGDDRGEDLARARVSAQTKRERSPILSMHVKGVRARVGFWIAVCSREQHENRFARMDF